jgi:hypothetical protein
VKRIGRYLPLMLLMLCLIPLAEAQSFFDVGIGFGYARDKAAALGIDQNTLLNCVPATSSTCVATPALSAFMMGADINLILWKHFGAGFQLNVQPAKQNYAVLQGAITSAGQPEIDLQSRVSFYDIDAVYQPVTKKKYAIQLKGGIAIANLKFYENVSGGNAVIGSFNQSQYAGSSNHFGGHFGGGVQIFVTDHIFIRPEYDGHYIRNLSQFGSNLVNGGMVWIGYSWGDR